MENTENITFETAYLELEKLVNEMESGTLDLETALQKYEAGKKLAETCRAQLDAAELKIKTLQGKSGD